MQISQPENPRQKTFQVPAEFKSNEKTVNQ